MPAVGAVSSSGPVVEITLDNVSHWREMLLQQEGTQLGLALPKPVPGLALIDTGATVSMVRADVAGRLGLAPAPAHLVQGLHPGKPFTAALPEPIRGAWVEFRLTGIDRPFPAHAGVLPFQFPDERVIAIIGRDVLARLELWYHGPSGRLRLEPAE